MLVQRKTNGKKDIVVILTQKLISLGWLLEVDRGHLSEHKHRVNYRRRKLKKNYMLNKINIYHITNLYRYICGVLP